MVLAAHGLFLVGPTHGRPHLGKVREAKTLWHHSGHKEVLPIHRDVMTHNVAVRAEMLLPEPVAEYDFVGTARLIFFGRENTAQHRRNSKRLEESCTHSARIYLLRLSDSS